ncbi:MAG: protein kinase, partial [Anaerolineales bacterium]
MTGLIGTILAGRYRVDAPIGRGGMAEVYKVWDTERSVYLAMKLLREDLADDKVFMRRFQREAKTLAKLQHPNIVRFYGLEEHKYLAFILMDYVDGEPLRRAIRKAAGPMPEPSVAEVFKALCAALGYAHKQGMVHCDIKPGNVMIHKNGTVLVTDFGIARMTDAATATMVGFGTPAYMAPELVHGKEPTPQTDIYALGVMLFEMLTGGERPFTGERAEIKGSTSDKVRWEQVNLMPPLPRRWNKAISEQLEGVVLKCLAKQPEKRFTSVIELMNALLRAAGAEPTVVVEEEPVADAPAEKRQPPKKKPKPEKTPSREDRAVGPRLPRWAWVAGAGLIAVTMLVIVGLTMSGGAQEPAAQLAESSSAATVSPTEQAQPSTAGLEIGSTMVSPVDGMTLVFVPEGAFEMGGGGGIYAEEDENPQHQVYLDGFWIDQTEVTNDMFAAFLNAQGNQEEGGVS